MTITLNEQLKNLRKNKGNTQEELASFLGVTVQAVSKWERGEGHPDIIFLPPLAAYYDVTVDDLLGVNEAAKEARLEEYKNENSILFNQGKTQDRILLWRKAKKEFPNNLDVIYYLMYALWAESYKEHYEEIVEYGEKILEKSTETRLREGAIQTLCLTYMTKDVEKAKKYAEKASCISCSKEIIMPNLLEGEECVKAYQANIQHFADDISRSIIGMAYAGNFSDDEKIKAFNTAKKIFEVIYNDGNFGFYHTRLADLYKHMAKAYMGMGMEDEVISCLEKATHHSIKYDVRENGMYTAFVVNRMEDDTLCTSKTFTENDSALMINELKHKRYTSIRDDERIKSIISELEKYAKY
jgi:transcriptional regulator with XRE-family HTH domain